tara:strand:- start:14670 stop:18110 length:3441 start_codon:yes stop_codon:yes gene_type:complete
MRRLSLLSIILLATLIAPCGAMAQEGQFYFVGKSVISDGPVAGATHVYLRWDTLEGDLAADVQSIRLLRNGEQLGQWPVSAVMTAAQINAIYQEVDQQQLKLETITRLNELASDSGNPFSAASFAQSLHQRINPALLDSYNPLWAFLGSRTDINIARARYRAWIDTTPVVADGRSVVEYELLAVAADASTARLGYLEIDPNQQQFALPATQFEQIRVSDWRCDLPDTAKDHYTVMLDWSATGAARVSDRVAAQAYVSGYDLYRTTENLDPAEADAPVRNIAALAAAAPIDDRGRPLIDGLEKVNVSLVIDSGAPSTDPEWLQARARLVEAGISVPTIPAERIPRQGKWVEAQDQLARAGLRPGDRRAYYLVPRDFAGDYGPTVATVVTVPLMTRPPAPWNLRSFADQTSAQLDLRSNALTFTWDEVNVDNYVKMYGHSRQFCNESQARNTGILEYVPIGGKCGIDPHRAIRLDVRDYRIYRFENFDIAGRFKDSDGDGVEDSFETPDFDGNGKTDAFERSAGLQCDSSTYPPDTEQNYLVYPSADDSVDLQRPSLQDSSAPDFARMHDTVPAGNRDTVYWYRIVSEANSPLPVGRLSHMSAPQRGLFPDRELPDPPTVSLMKPGQKPQGCNIELGTVDDGSWSFAEQILEDESQRISVSCTGYDAAHLVEALRNKDSKDCINIANACQNRIVTLDFPPSAATGDVACSAPVPFNALNQFCSAGSVNVVPQLVDTLVPAAAGDLVAGGARGNASPPPPDERGSYCVSVFETIDGTSSRIGSTCDAGGLDFRARAGLFCGYAVATDQNNNISTTVQFPCTVTPEHPKTPSPPQILSFDVTSSEAQFSIRLPAERIAIALARLDHEPASGEPTSAMESIPVIDNVTSDAINVTMPVTALQGEQDRFCLKVMSVGGDDGTGNAPSSDWSAEKCFVRTPAGEDTPTYLTWPRVQGATEGAPLIASLVTDHKSLQPFLSLNMAVLPEIVGDGSELSHCWVEARAATEFDAFGCWDGGLAKFHAALDPELRFILYRQQRLVGDVISTRDWIQVSPLIDYVHLDSEVIPNGDSSLLMHTLNDPYFKVGLGYMGAGGSQDPQSLTVWFVDQYPFLQARDAAGNEPFEWRYQAVYFDRQHRPVSYRVSDWFSGSAP